MSFWVLRFMTNLNDTLNNSHVKLNEAAIEIMNIHSI